MIFMNNNEIYDYDDLEARAREIIEILTKKNVSMEDIMQLSSKTEEEIIEIRKELGLCDVEK